MVVLLDLNYPLHGYLHTFIGAIIVGLALGYVMYLFNEIFEALWKRLFLVSGSDIGLKQFIITGISGAILHVVLDAPLYYDIKPLYPISFNPIYNPGLTLMIYMVCLILGIIGLIYYLYMVLK